MTDSIQLYPAWAKELSKKYLSNGASVFVLHGNVFDLVPMAGANGKDYVPLIDFCRKDLFAKRGVFITYDLGSGIVVNPEAREVFFSTVQAIDTATGTSFAGKLPKDPVNALFILERYIKARLLDKDHKPSIAIIIDFAHMIAPRGDLQYMNQNEFRTILTFLKWANDPELLESDVTVCLIVENLNDLNDMLIKNPFIMKIEIALPNKEERLDFIRHRFASEPFLALAVEMDPEILATQTNALKRIDMDNLLLEAKHEKQINVGFLKKKKKELIERNCYGLLEFLEPSLTLDSVIGHDAAKKRLREDISLLKKGHLDALPVGYLFCGPVGTGKTFLATCTIGEIGIPCVKLLNFRSQWLGVTEGNLERILSTLRALGPVGVIIDEADAFMGDRESSGDSGVSSRVFSQFAIQMGDTRFRGRVIWFLLTCRPDLLPVDIKRQGRIEIHIPMFYPDSDAEKIGIITSMCKKEKFDIDANAIPLELITRKSMSGADIEAIVVRAKRLFLLAETPREKEYYVQEALKDFISTTDSDEVKLQELAAVVECTERNFLPARYQETGRTDTIREYNRLKTLIDYR